MLVPQPKYLSIRVPFTASDLAASRRAMACHRSQYSEEIVQRVHPVMATGWNGVISVSPAFSTTQGTDLFR